MVARVAEELRSPASWARATIVENGEPWRLYPWLDLLNTEVVRTIVCGENTFAAAPPQHGKSTFMSLATPTWWLVRNAMLGRRVRILMISYNTEYAQEWSEACMLHLKKWGPRYGLHYRRGGTSRKRIRFTNGSTITAAGLRGGITGRSADLTILDDPMKSEEEANSPTIRTRIWREIGKSVETRSQEHAAILWIQTLWNVEDPGNQLIRSQADPHTPRWNILRFPALAEPGDILGRRPGEPLCPQRFSREKLHERRRNPRIGKQGWLSMYQCRPVPDEGAVWQKSYFRTHSLSADHLFVHPDGDDGKHVRFPVEHLSRFATVDLALGKKDSDNTVISLWGWHAGLQRLFWLNCWFGLFNSPETKRRIRELLKPDSKNPHKTAAVVWVESNQYQESLVQDMKYEGLAVRELPSLKDKLARLRAVEPWGEQRRISHDTNAHWRDAAEEQLLQFTGKDGEADDIVDTFSAAGRVAMEGKAGTVDTKVDDELFDLIPKARTRLVR